jgi:hypothetical protein
MSTAPSPPAVNAGPREIRIVGHSNLFYYWPVWAFGFLLGLLTFWDGHTAAIVPHGTKAERGVNVTVGGTTYNDRDVLILPDRPSNHFLPPVDAAKPDDPWLKVAGNSGYGVLFATVLLLVITITNVPLRGLWSFVIIGGVVMVALVFHIFGLWTSIFYYFSLLDIRLNMGGYFFISSLLFAIWLITGIFFDQQIYMVFTPGQMKVCLEIGGGETAYDTVGLVIQKERSDLFRHWVLGLGSGDLVVRTSGSTTHEFHLNNVLFITRKLQQIEEMQRDRPMVKG